MCEMAEGVTTGHREGDRPAGGRGSQLCRGPEAVSAAPGLTSLAKISFRGTEDLTLGKKP